MASRRTEKQNMLREYEKVMEEQRQQEEIERREYEAWYEEWYKEWKGYCERSFQRELGYDDYDDYEGRYAYGYWA